MLRTVLMDSDKRSAEVERLEVVETGRRRRWSEDEKLKIVLERLQAPRQPHLCSQNRTAEVARRENASKSRGSGAVVAVSGALRPGAGLPKARKLGVFPDRRISTNILILKRKIRGGAERIRTSSEESRVGKEWMSKRGSGW